MFQQCVKSRKSVAACIVTAWLVLFGVVFAEGLGLYEDTPENLDQQVEQVLSSDNITDTQPADFVSVAYVFTDVVAALPACHTLRVGPRFSVDVGKRIARTTKGLALYRLYSTYLI